MDWKQQLNSLKSSGTLPEGEDTVENVETQPSDVKLPTLSVILDKKGRKGKTATIIEGFDPDDPHLEEIASNLKRKLATGGSIRNGEILIQGDRKNEVTSILKSLGYKLK